MLKSGYAKSKEEMQEIMTYFNNQLPEYSIEDLGFREKLWLYKAHLWYSFLVQDFLSCYKYSSKWVNLFNDNQQMIFINPVWYIKGNSYLLECLYLIKHKSYMKEVLEKLEKTIALDAFPKNDNLTTLYFLCYYNSKFSLHFLEGDFEGGLYLVDEVLKNLKKNEDRIDEHHIMVFYYKIASLYFGAGNNKKCIEYLKKIIDNKNLSMREDLMCFARVLSLVAHYEAGMDYRLEVQLKSTYKFLIKMNDLHEVQREMIKFLRNLGTIFPHELKSEFKKLHDRLIIFENHPYEKRAFLYLDIISWLESKIENKPVAEIIQEKAKKLIR
jgi:tetratricopeptide (TPR) repeat protein